MPTESLDEKAIFNVARQIGSPDARAEYLRQACGTDSGLRERVQVLLIAYEEQASFLESPPPVGFALTIDQSESESPDTVIGPYKLVEQIGEGGMGSVWMAQQTEPVKRLVAVKLIKAGMDSKQVVARFEAERQALALMDHPNIARVLDAGTTEAGRPYFVMDLVKGVPITKFCDEHRLTPRQRLELFLPVCQAVQHAHQKGVIHRDLKPTNVLVALYDDKPVPKVIDFGVAKAAGQQLTDRTLITGFGAIVGTPEYMSPEQAEVNQLDIDTRSDIYSLGVLLYELLAGSPPFTRKELEKAGMLEMLRVIREREPSRPSTKLSTADGLPALAANRGTEPAKLTRLVKGELDWIVMKALEKDRNRRYETANGFAVDVQRYLAGEAVQAHPPSTAYRLRKYVRRNKGVLAVAALVALVLVVGIIGTTWGMVRATRAEAHAVSEATQKTVALKDKEAALDRARDSEREKTRQLAQSYFKEAQAKRFSGRTGRRFESLELLKKAAASYDSLGELTKEKLLELRNESIACLALVDLKKGQEWELEPGWRGDGPFFSSNLEFYAVTQGPSEEPKNRRGAISVRRLSDHAEIAYLPDIGAVPYRCQFSANGRFLAVDHYAKMPWRFSLWDLSRSELILKLPPAVASGDSAFSPDSQSLLVHYQDATVALHELPSGKEVKRLRVEQAGVGDRLPAFRFHPSGRKVAFDTPAGVQILDPDTENVIRLPQPAETEWHGAYDMAWNNDGRLLAIACGADASQQFHAYVWDLVDLDQPRQIHVLKGHQSEVVRVVFNDAGDLLMTGSWDNTLRFWDPWTGRQHLSAAAPRRFHTRFSPDGRRLGAGRTGPSVWLWDVATGQELRTFHGHTGYKQPWSVDIHPDGRLMASSDDSGIRLWDLAAVRESDQPVGFIPQGGKVQRVIFHSNGDSLITIGEGAGVQRWPLMRDGERVRVGPPESIGSSARAPLPVIEGTGALSRDGRTVAFLPTRWAGLVFDLNAPNQATALLGHSLEEVAVSPDGKWVAGCAIYGEGTPVWDARTGERVKLLPHRGRSSPRFSPDGRWLALNSGQLDSGETRFWAVGTWTAAHGVQPKDANTRAILHAFSCDGRMAAVLHSPSGFIQLIDPASGQEFATLQPPDGHWANSLSFSTDGSQLAVTGSGAIHVWDLRLIRRQLAEMGLDWELPGYSRPTSHADKPLRAEILSAAPLVPDKALDAEAYLGRARLYARLERYSEAAADFKQAIKLAPQFEPRDGSDYFLRGLWSTEGKHWERAVTDFTRALKLRPNDAQAYYYRGICREHLGQLSQARNEERAARQNFVLAVADLTKAIALRPDARPYWSRRGHIHAEMAEWRQADLDYTKATELPGSIVWEWYYHALLRLRVGDTGGYRRACATTLERFGKSKPNWVIVICLMGRDAVSDWSSVIALAEQSLANDPNNYNNLNDLGAVLYRAGRWEEAVKRLTEAGAMVKDAKFARGTVASTWCFLAMAYHQLGHADEAGRWLRKASALLEEAEMESPEDDRAEQRLTWERQLRRQLLRREAEELVKKEPGIRNQNSEKKPQ